MKYGAYHVWLRVNGLTANERQAALLTLEDAGWEWDFPSEPDASVWIAPLIKGDNPDRMEKHAVRTVRSVLPRAETDWRSRNCPSRGLSAGDQMSV